MVGRRCEELRLCPLSGRRNADAVEFDHSDIGHAELRRVHANGGTTTLNGDTITLQGANALAGVESGVGGTTINGGFVTTNGANSIAVYATRAGSTVTTTNLDATGQ